MAEQINLFAGRSKTDPDRAARQAIYKSARWKRLRAIILRRHPICQCGEIDEATGNICERPSNQVHHVQDIADAPELTWKESNLVALNRICHSRETNRRLKGK